MTQEEKQLLLIDLCARLPYGVKIGLIGAHKNLIGRPFVLDIEDYKNSNPLIIINSNWLPYLRPMSSMTQEEIDEYDSELDKDLDIVMNGALDKDRHITSDGKHNFSKNFVAHFGNDWLNKNMFDYRGLIPTGIAIEAPKDMYKHD